MSQTPLRHIILSDRNLEVLTKALALAGAYFGPGERRSFASDEEWASVQEVVAAAAELPALPIIIANRNDHLRMAVRYRVPHKTEDRLLLDHPWFELPGGKAAQWSPSNRDWLHGVPTIEVKVP